mmetsp:Transcript_55082/g.123146  ORF Transcript_55082/g.123146 Transcript_55082/m.123146 type:complete len:100 (+) Transcript_55082:82-381(+)
MMERWPSEDDRTFVRELNALSIEYVLGHAEAMDIEAAMKDLTGCSWTSCSRWAASGSAVCRGQLFSAEVRRGSMWQTLASVSTAHSGLSELPSCLASSC